MSAYIKYAPAILAGGGGGGGGGDTFKRAANVAITSGQASVAVTFSSAEADTTYVIVFSIQNTVDANPIFLQGYISAKSTSGFTVKFNAPASTANYILTYSVVGAA